MSNLKPQRGSQVERSMLPPLTCEVASRLLYFQRMFAKAAELPGDVVECGVGWGWSLLCWAMLIRQDEKRRQLWGFDSFEGFPEPSRHDQSSRNIQKGDWKTDLNSVLAMLEGSGLDREFVRYRITLVKGFLEQTLPRYTGQRIALLHLDVDLHDSYQVALEELYPKVVPGGLILFDEYMNTMEYEKFPGARKAIDGFFDGREAIQRDSVCGKYFVVKREGLGP